MVPWLALPPCTFIAKQLTEYLIIKEWSLTRVRKVVQSICFLSQNIALFIMCQSNNFYVALTCMTIIIGEFIFHASVTQLIDNVIQSISGGTGFHNNAVIVNPQDIAPSYSGSVFGLMNTFGSIPGFLGVYLAGHILELTQSWPAVFSTAALINSFGWFIFVVFGTAQPIV